MRWQRQHQPSELGDELMAVSLSFEGSLEFGATTVCWLCTGSTVMQGATLSYI